MTKLPIPQSYWVQNGVFLAGQYPGHEGDARKARRKVQALVDAGVTGFVDLTHARDRMTPYEPLLNKLAPLVARAHLPIRDMSVPQAPEQMRRILDFIDAEMARGGRVYLHCWGGHGRTGTVVGCWLRRQGFGPEEALDELRRLRTRQATSEWQSDGPQTAQQFDYIRNWSEAGS